MRCSQPILPPVLVTTSLLRLVSRRKHQDFPSYIKIRVAAAWGAELPDQASAEAHMHCSAISVLGQVTYSKETGTRVWGRKEEATLMSQMSAVYEHEHPRVPAVTVLLSSTLRLVVLKYKLVVLKKIKDPLCNMLLHSSTVRGGPHAREQLRS